MTTFVENSQINGTTNIRTQSPHLTYQF